MSSAESGTVDVKGWNIYYNVIPGRRANAPTLVFIHEGLGSVRAWADFPERIVEKTGLPAFAYDRRGYGRSDPYDFYGNMNYMHEAADFLYELLPKMGIARPFLIGHSDGGSIALIFAARHPIITEGVITIAAHTMVEPICVEGAQNAGELFTSGRLRDKLIRLHGDKADTAFRSWQGNWTHPDFPKWTIEEMLPAIDCPALAIQGDMDEFGSVAQLESIERNVPGAETHIIKDCRHIPHLQSRAETERLVGDFINKINFD
ncbi:MAG: alpha/beta fold hydrolase [Candidatus Kapaibacterium sp.]